MVLSISPFVTKVPFVALKLILSNSLCIITWFKLVFSEIPLSKYCFIYTCPLFFHFLGPFSKHLPSGPMLSISRNVRLCVRVFVCVSVWMSVCLFVCVFTFEVPLKRLFAPTSQSRMSNIFGDSESLGKSNGKKWPQIGTFCQKLSKIAAQFFFFFCWFYLTNHGGNHAFLDVFEFLMIFCV